MVGRLTITDTRSFLCPCITRFVKACSDDCEPLRGNILGPRFLQCFLSSLRFLECLALDCSQAHLKSDPPRDNSGRKVVERLPTHVRYETEAVQLILENSQVFSLGSLRPELVSYAEISSTALSLHVYRQRSFVCKIKLRK